MVWMSQRLSMMKRVDGKEGVEKEKGVPAEMWLELELKLVADIGIVGAPNAGKSTLLTVISAAQLEIAKYPFTTLLPNLGVVSLDFDATMVVADLLGLLEGAHRGFGLGHEFLRHTERCSVLVHIVDGSGQQPEYEYEAVRLELELFSPQLCKKPYIVVYNKMDLPKASERWESFKESLQDRGIEPFCISVVNRQGTHEVVCVAYVLLRKKSEILVMCERFYAYWEINASTVSFGRQGQSFKHLNKCFFLLHQQLVRICFFVSYQIWETSHKLLVENW